jgi:heat-inducible transcriptional repressor
MGLSRRELAVLVSVVELYSSSGTPVASRQIAESSNLGLSPATIRNVMASLEEQGLLTRSHSSAGRIPTDRGFRLYVDSLQPRRRLSVKTRQRLESRISSSRRELVEGLEWVAQLTADLTHEAGMAMRPVGEEPALEAISLMPLGGRRVLAVVVTSDGAIEKKVLIRDALPRAGDLQEEGNHLTRKYRGSSIDQIRRLVNNDPEPGAVDGLQRRAELTAGEIFSEDLDEVEIQVAGTDNLLMSSDFAEAERVRSLMSTLQDRDTIAREWRRAFQRGPTQVIIGRESELTASGNLGMVATLYFRGGRRAGALGVVGPRRMDYGRIVPMVEFIGDTLTRMLDEVGATHA